MPYSNKSELPDSVQHVLPAHAQEIYKEAFNSAWDQYKHKEDRRDDASREETAHKVAWAVVKMSTKKAMMISGIRRSNRFCYLMCCLSPCPRLVHCLLSNKAG